MLTHQNKYRKKHTRNGLGSVSNSVYTIALRHEVFSRHGGWEPLRYGIIKSKQYCFNIVQQTWVAVASKELKNQRQWRAHGEGRRGRRPRASSERNYKS